MPNITEAEQIEDRDEYNNVDVVLKKLTESDNHTIFNMVFMEEKVDKDTE